MGISSKIRAAVSALCVVVVIALLQGCAQVGSSQSAPATPAVPAAPANLIATAGNAQVALGWTASAGATSYSVQRSTTSGGPYAQVATVAAPGFADTGVINGTKYFYVVSASDAAGASGNSAEVNATPVAPAAAPATPTGLIATGGNTQVSLTWNISAGATSYNVKRSTLSGGPYAQIAAPMTANFTDTGLTAGTAYFYVVSAVDSAGESANSAQASATTSAAQVTYALTVVNGTGSGSYAAGATATITASAPPAGQEFLDWTGATVASATAPTTTLVMPASAVTITANYAAPAQGEIPFPVTTHPRLWVTQADLPRLQSWANSSNQVYAQGLQPVLNTAVNLYNTQFFPGGVANPNYPDPGDTQGYTGYLTEEYGAILAFNSMIDPNPANRITYAQDARNMLMYAMNQAALGPLAGAPFRDPLFATYNRASLSGEEWPLMVDWIYNAADANSQPILSAADKATIRNVFMMWESECETASTTGGDSPQIPGVFNSLQLLPNNLPYRFAANNYYTAHARLMTMMALAIDPSDDPPINSSLASSVLGNSLRSYLTDAVGAWLYQQYAMYGEAAAVTSAYGVPGNGAGFGLASGGLPPEGMLYGVSYGNILDGLLALQTAGFNNPAYAAYTGPQIGLIGAPMWDRYVTGIFSSLTPQGFVPTEAGESYLGQVYQFASYGDLLRLYVTPDYMTPFALLALLEQEQGQSTHLADARWFDYNVAQGGPPAFYSRMTDPYTFAETIQYYMLFDPSVAYTAPADPRPGFPTVFVDPGGGRIVAHTNWTATGTMFDYRASWESINHQDGNAGQFELFRDGEWLTKELSNYDSNNVGMTTYYHNTLGLQNNSPSGSPTINWWETGELANGSQWMIGENAGDPITVDSSGTGYVYATTDMTNLYNRPDIYTPSNSIDMISQATRSILWLNGDYIVVYDRATSTSGGLFKRWNLTLITNPVISGNTATETLASGQQLFVQTLLPANPTITARYAVSDLTTVAELEPSQYVMTVQDASNPIDARFLHVLQGANSGAAMVPAVYLQSSSGTAFDGAAFGSTAAFFPVSASAQIVTTVLTVPAGVHTLFVAGLASSTAYGGSVVANGSGHAVTITPGTSGATTDPAGLLQLTF
jgi:hypothetical protein